MFTITVISYLFLFFTPRYVCAGEVSSDNLCSYSHIINLLQHKQTTQTDANSQIPGLQKCKENEINCNLKGKYEILEKEDIGPDYITNGVTKGGNVLDNVVIGGGTEQIMPGDVVNGEKIEQIIHDNDVSGGETKQISPGNAVNEGEMEQITPDGVANSLDAHQEMEQIMSDNAVRIGESEQIIPEDVIGGEIEQILPDDVNGGEIDPITHDDAVNGVETEQVVLDNSVIGAELEQIMPDGVVNEGETERVALDNSVNGAELEQIMPDGVVNEGETEEVAIDNSVNAAELEQIIPDGVLIGRELEQIMPDGVGSGGGTEQVALDNSMNGAELEQIMPDGVVNEGETEQVALDNSVIGAESEQIMPDGEAEQIMPDNDVNGGEVEGFVPDNVVTGVEIEQIITDNAVNGGNIKQTIPNDVVDGEETDQLVPHGTTYLEENKEPIGDQGKVNGDDNDSFEIGSGQNEVQESGDQGKNEIDQQSTPGNENYNDAEKYEFKTEGDEVLLQQEQNPIIMGENIEPANELSAAEHNIVDSDSLIKESANELSAVDSGDDREGQSSSEESSVNLNSSNEEQNGTQELASHTNGEPMMNEKAVLESTLSQINEKKQEIVENIEETQIDGKGDEDIELQETNGIIDQDQENVEGSKKNPNTTSNQFNIGHDKKKQDSVGLDTDTAKEKAQWDEKKKSAQSQDIHDEKLKNDPVVRNTYLDSEATDLGETEVDPTEEEEESSDEIQTATQTCKNNDAAIPPIDVWVNREIYEQCETNGEGEHEVEEDLNEGEDITEIDLKMMEDLIEERTSLYQKKIQELEIQVLRVENQILAKAVDKHEKSAYYANLESQLLKLENDILRFNQTFNEMKTETLKLQTQQQSQANDLALVKKTSTASGLSQVNETFVYGMIQLHESQIQNLTHLVNRQTVVIEELETKAVVMETENKNLGQKVARQGELIEGILQRLENMTITGKGVNSAGKEAENKVAVEEKAKEKSGMNKEIVDGTPKEEKQAEKMEAEKEENIDIEMKEDMKALDSRSEKEEEALDKELEKEDRKKEDVDSENEIDERGINQKPESDSKMEEFTVENGESNKENIIEEAKDKEEKTDNKETGDNGNKNENHEENGKKSTATTEREKKVLRADKNETNAENKIVEMEENKNKTNEKNKSKEQKSLEEAKTDNKNNGSVKSDENKRQTDHKKSQKKSKEASTGSKTKATQFKIPTHHKYTQLHPAFNQDCYAAYKKGKRHGTSLSIRPGGIHKDIGVFCDMKRGGWTMIMRRFDGSVNFLRGWYDYKHGFKGRSGLYGELWLGLDYIHHITNQGNYQLRIDMLDWDGNRRYAEYDYFMVEDERNGYKLHVIGYSGDAGDSLTKHDGHKFSTIDVDNDLAGPEYPGGSCAKRFSGAWWYYKCYSSNLNGKYYKGGALPEKTFDGVAWKAWTGPKYSLKRVEMKIRPVQAKENA